MGVKSNYASADEIPEALAEHYAESGGRWVLQVDDLNEHPQVRGVVTANKANAAKRDELRAKLTEVEARLSAVPEDFDAEEWTSLKAGLGKPAADQKAAQDQATASLKKLYEDQAVAREKKHAADVAALQEQLSERDGWIDRNVVDEGLRAALMTAGAEASVLDGAISLLRPKVKVDRSEDGSRRAIVSTDLGDVSAADYAKSWLGSDGAAYKARASGPEPKGGNARSGGAKAISRADYEKLSPGDQSAKMRDGFTISG